METSLEKRSEQRHSLQTPIVFTIFSTLHWAERNSECTSISRKGMSFVSDRPLSPKTMIRIRSVRPEALKLTPQELSLLRSAAMGEVKWCRPVLSRSGHSFFQIGLRFI
jgi:hypothetical protein